MSSFRRFIALSRPFSLELLKPLYLSYLRKAPREALRPDEPCGDE
jgi:hypothetical protein